MSSDHSHAHAHGGHHHHHGGGDHDFAQANADHFDKMVDEYENIPGARELMNHVGRALRATGAFDKESTTVLDFACGVGMLSREIFPVCKSIVGVDISKGSVEAYNRTAAAQGIAPEGMHAIALDILKEGPNALDGQKFDVVVCSMAYHHFEHPDRISRVLANYLKPNGKLFVLDFSTGHPMHKAEHRQALKGELEHVVPHLDGFSEEVMRTMFVDGAGLGAFGYADVCRVPAPMPREMAEKFTDEERMIDVFLAEGTKSA